MCQEKKLFKTFLEVLDLDSDFQNHLNLMEALEFEREEEPLEEEELEPLELQ